MRQRGITVAVAGDNCRDSSYAYGDNDMVDTFRQAVRILHLGHPLAGAPALVGPTPLTSGPSGRLLAGHVAALSRSGIARARAWTDKAPASETLS